MAISSSSAYSNSYLNLSKDHERAIPSASSDLFFLMPNHSITPVNSTSQTATMTTHENILDFTFEDTTSSSLPMSHPPLDPDILLDPNHNIFNNNGKTSPLHDPIFDETTTTEPENPSSPSLATLCLSNNVAKTRAFFEKAFEKNSEGMPGNSSSNPIRNPHLSHLFSDRGEDDTDSLEERVLASLSGDFGSYEESVREELRQLSEFIAISSKKLEDDSSVQKGQTSDASLTASDGKQLPRVKIDLVRRYNPMDICRKIREYETQKELLESEREYHELNRLESALRKDIQKEMNDIEDKFNYDYSLRRKEIQALLHDQHEEINQLWTRRILKYDSVAVVLMNDMAERHQTEFATSQEKYRKAFLKKKPTLSKSTLAEKNLLNVLSTSKMYELGNGLEAKIYDLEKKDLANFFNQQEYHVAKKLEHLSQRQHQELCAAQQKIDKGRNAMEKDRESDIKKLDSRTTILFRDLEKKRNVILTQIQHFRDKFNGVTSGAFRRKSSEYFSTWENLNVQEPVIHISACLEFFNSITDKIIQFFNTVDKSETEIEKETCKTTKRLLDSMDQVITDSPKTTPEKKKHSTMRDKNASTCTFQNEQYSKLLSPPASPAMKDKNNNDPTRSTVARTTSLFIEEAKAILNTPEKVKISNPSQSSLNRSTSSSKGLAVATQPNVTLDDCLKKKKKPSAKHTFSELIRTSFKWK
ncbi:hypothetical protein C9374_009988 [Naegleria lovaniensis]|uniref:Uncharacterized protein n=1 Tax=Naegleria lovaniensis TaxID=51637 RepID=A0AA88KE82_NAELO|nr:uncharacterized protein C9374_009988 [Naegleria lovaniensis]KAG2375365.1 hypothetical protein C9374_009988 [Naegleria lovaniensis]